MFQSAFAGEWLESRTISNTFCEGNQLPVRQPGQSKDNFQLFFQQHCKSIVESIIFRLRSQFLAQRHDIDTVAGFQRAAFKGLLQPELQAHQIFLFHVGRHKNRLLDSMATVFFEDFDGAVA